MKMSPAENEGGGKVSTELYLDTLGLKKVYYFNYQHFLNCKRSGGGGGGGGLPRRLFNKNFFLILRKKNTHSETSRLFQKSMWENYNVVG